MPRLPFDPSKPVDHDFDLTEHLPGMPDLEEPEQAERPSKSQRKREMLALQDLGERLVALPRDRLDSLALPERLYEAVREAQRIRSHEGRRRQLQYVGKLMRDVDPTPILARFAVWDGDSKEEALRFQQLERQRDLLLDSDEALTELIAEHPGLDVQALRSLVRAARRERETNAALPAGRGPQRKHYRALFQALKALDQLNDSNQELDDDE